RSVAAERRWSPPAVTTVDPANVRPSLATAAAESLDALTDSLLHAAASATKPAWITVECSSCGERSRVEAPVPDVRARVAAIELLLWEGLGRPAAAEETRHATDADQPGRSQGDGLGRLACAVRGELRRRDRGDAGQRWRGPAAREAAQAE